MLTPQFNLDLSSELIVDNFAGGGGASMGIELALGRPPDIAVNHDPQAVALHQANHPQTQHFCEDVFKVDPVKATAGRPVGLAWFSPDCKHFSKAKGGKPRSKKIRGLAWVVVKWAATVRPRVVILENVEEFQKWGPLLKDGSPCPKRVGKTFRNFIRRLENLGYDCQWRELRACDYGAPTIRKRLFLVARCDGQPIVWPEPTHADPAIKYFRRLKLKPWRTAAECIDWTLPCPSIFLTRAEARRFGVKRPLATATLRRLARGIQRFVIETKRPFIVPGSVPFLTEHANASNQRSFALNEPMRTQCAEVKGGHFALVQAFLAKHYGGVTGSRLAQPIGTITSVDHHSLVASHLTKFYGTNIGQRTGEPLHSITAQGNHIAEVRAFLVKYYGNEKDGVSCREPIHTIPTHDRFGLVMVSGEAYQISDIGMRMLSPRELYRGQGFPDSYIIETQIEVERRGKKMKVPLSNQAQVRMCGNSVCPPIARALVSANVPELSIKTTALAA